MPDGGLTTFHVVESPVMAPALSQKYPQIKTYKVRSTDDGNVSGRVDIGPNGFHAYINSPGGVVYINPDTETTDVYFSFYNFS